MKQSLLFETTPTNYHEPSVIPKKDIYKHVHDVEMIPEPVSSYPSSEIKIKDEPEEVSSSTKKSPYRRKKKSRPYKKNFETIDHHDQPRHKKVRLSHDYDDGAVTWRTDEEALLGTAEFFPEVTAVEADYEKETGRPVRRHDSHAIIKTADKLGERMHGTTVAKHHHKNVSHFQGRRRR